MRLLHWTLFWLQLLLLMLLVTVLISHGYACQARWYDQWQAGCRFSCLLEGSAPPLVNLTGIVLILLGLTGPIVAPARDVRQHARWLRKLSIPSLAAVVLWLAIFMLPSNLSEYERWRCDLFDRPPPANCGYGSCPRPIPAAAWMKRAKYIIDLLANYSPDSRLERFSEAKKYLWEPVLTDIEEYEANPDKNSFSSEFVPSSKEAYEISYEEQTGIAAARLNGTLTKKENGKIITQLQVTYLVKMAHIPRTSQNNDGIIVFKIDQEDQKQNLGR